MATQIMDAEHSARYLELLLNTYPERPIFLLWDRAPWHRGQPIRELLTANPRLEIWFLPTAAPDLNPQEHVWKAAREAVSHNHQIAKLQDLADRFQRFLTDTTFSSSLLHKHAYNSLCATFT